MEVKFVVAVVATCLAIVLDIVGLAIPYWNSFTIQRVTVHLGLWTYCSSAIQNVCLSLSAVGPVRKYLLYLLVNCFSSVYLDIL